MRIKIYCLLFSALLLGGYNSYAQTKSVLDQSADEVCEGLKDLDPAKTTSDEVSKALKSVMIKTFAKHMNELMSEMNMDHMNEENGRKIGEEIGRRMLTRCPSYIDLTSKLNTTSKNPELNINSSQGILTKINTTGDFVQFIIKDVTGRETNYYWLRYFKGSEIFENNTLTSIGKKLKVQWSEIEFYIPKAKGYYKLKEVKSIDFL